MQESDISPDNYPKIMDKTVIRKSLERVTNSQEFKDSKRSKQLLNYIVEKYLAGETAQINGTTIAQDVLGAGVDFDPSTNPIVRVQAGRLRTLLSEYYRRSGKDDDVLIYVAKGQYAPQFGKRTTKQQTTTTSKNNRAYTTRKTVKWFAIGLMSIVLLAALFIGLRNNQPAPLQAVQSNAVYPSIAILPFQNMTNDPSKDVFKQGFQHQLGTDLSRFKVVRVIFSDLQYEQILAQNIPIANYVLEGTFLSIETEIDLLIKFINVKSGETITQHRVKRRTDDDSYFNALVDISSNLSGKFVGQDGSLVRENLENIKLGLADHTHTNIKAFECLSVFHMFEADKSAENFNHAANCLTYQVAQNKTDSTLLAALAWVMAYGSPETGLFTRYQIEGDYSLTRALQTAEKAIALNPGNNMAYQYVALIQWRIGQHDAAIQSIRRSLQLNPAATGNLANLGHFLSFTGDWENGLKATRDAITQNPQAPYWYFTPLFMRAVLDKNEPDATLYSQKLASVRGTDDQVYLLIAAAIANDIDTIERLTPVIKAYAFDHGGDPLYITRRWVQSSMVIDALEAELKSVGISVPEN